MKSKGGIERLMLEYAEKSTHEVTLVTHYLSENFEEYDVEVKKLTDKTVPEGFLKRGFISAPRIISEKLDLKEYDVLLVSEAGLGSFITLRNHEIPVVCYCHTPLRAAHQFYSHYREQYGFPKNIFFSFAASVYRFIEKKAWKNFDHVFANSQNTINNIEIAGLAEKVEKEVVHPGADLSRFKSGEEEKFFFYPSRFKKYKRQDLAVRAFEKFSENVEEDYRLVLAGFPDDKEYVEELRKNSSDKVEIKTDVSDSEMVDLYSRCTAVLFTAKNEDWGIVPVEAMASGKPVVAVEEGGPSESVINGETGFLVEAEPEKIGSKMSELVENTKMYKDMCRNSRERAKEFTWGKFAEKMDKRIKEVVEN